VVEFIATITSVGRSSMEVWVEVSAEDLKGGPRHLVVNAFVTMVAVDESGQPRPVPSLTLTNEDERRRAEEARRRMVARRSTRPRGAAVPSTT